MECDETADAGALPEIPTAKKQRIEDQEEALEL